MKFSVATVVAFAAAVFAQPKLGNSKYDIVEGEPFEITWYGQQGEVTLTLKNGPSGALNTVKVIKADITGDSFTWTPEGIPSGTYAIEINDDSKVPNYSPQFQYEGTGPALSSAASSAPVTSSAVSSSTSAPVSSSDSTVTSSASESSSESSSTTSTTRTSTTSTRPATTPTNNNQSEGQRYSSPLALLLVTVAGVIFFN